MSCLSLVLTLGLTLNARANPAEEARREIQAHCDTYSRAMERNEFQGTLAYRAPDYTYTLVSGSANCRAFPPGEAPGNISICRRGIEGTL